MAIANAEKTEANSALAALVGKTHRTGDLAYGGDLDPKDVYDYLRAHGGMLIDVRTTPEWQFTGVADLSATKGALLTMSWKHYPNFTLNPDFTGTLAQAATPETPLFFMCRSGGRSLDAAVAMTAQGYRYCFNVTGGFEGEPNEQGHRGHVEGWKAANLPWKQG